jgi:hypothetical protein
MIIVPTVQIYSYCEVLHGMPDITVIRTLDKAVFEIESSWSFGHNCAGLSSSVLI